MNVDNYYSKNNRPIKCQYCECEELTETVEDQSGGQVFEKSITCSECNSMLGYWAYGAYDPFFRKTLTEVI
jgi:hypothetical protein